MEIRGKKRATALVLSYDRNLGGRRPSPDCPGESMLSRIGVALAATTALILTVVPAAQAAKLSAPATGAPAHGAVVETVPSFTWRAVRGAAQYEFQVAADTGFGSIVDKGAFRTRNTAGTLKTSLANGTYFWRVRAITAGDAAGPWARPRAPAKAGVRAPE